LKNSKNIRKEDSTNYEHVVRKLKACGFEIASVTLLPQKTTVINVKKELPVEKLRLREERGEDFFE